MNCTVYRSGSREFTYVYLREGMTFEDLPEALRTVFGEPHEVMVLELSPERTLAQEDVTLVMENLRRDGYHLQLPPHEDPSGWLDLPTA